MALRRVVQRGTAMFLILWLACLLLLYRRWSVPSNEEDTVAGVRSAVAECDSQRLEEQLSGAFRELEQLKRQNLQLIDLLKEIREMHEGTDHKLPEAVNQVISEMSVTAKNTAARKSEDTCPLTYEAEQTRRRVENGVREMYYFVNSQLKQTSRKSDDTYFHETFREQYVVMLNTFKQLANITDTKINREQLSKQLTKKVQQRLYYIQHPEDCESARKLVCNINKGCGFGCQFHHLLYCFTVSYATGRVLQIESSGWRYASHGWDGVFLPVTTCSKVDSRVAANFDESTEMKSPVVQVPIIDALGYRPNYLPLAIPEDIAADLTTLHGNAYVWWCGQLVRYLWRYQQPVRSFFEKTLRDMQFEHPIVGMHVRRTDKVGSEAALHTVSEYFEWAELFYRQYELEHGPIALRRVYIATDDPGVITEARKLYSNYVILGDEARARSGGVDARYADQSLLNLLVDIDVLSRCEYVVCTFSSQVCRVAYELMQTRHDDASARVQSLDDIYYFGGQNGHNYRALYGHEADKQHDLMDMQPGDLLGMAGNHWDGHSKAMNMRTRRNALFHTFKAEDVVSTARTPFSYAEIDRRPPPPDSFFESLKD